MSFIKRTHVSHDELTDFLRAIVAGKGPGAEARPGQVALAEDILDALQNHETFSGIAPPGTGKSFAYLACAALLAAAGCRVLVSTEMLGLQRQLVDDDLPMVVTALREYCGFELRYASFMGVNNYADPGRLLSMVEAMTAGAWSPGKSHSFTPSQLFDARETLRNGFDAGYVPTGAGAYSGVEVLRELVLWGLDAYLDGGRGDRVSMSRMVEAASADDWSLVAAGSDDRSLGDDLKGFEHKYDEARQYALHAHIVVANHALLGIEAYTGGGTIMETVKAGSFDHIIIDEAHALPGGIRNAGDGKVAGATFREIGGRAVKLLNDFDINTEMTQFANELDTLIEQAVGKDGTRGVLNIDPDSIGILSEAFTDRGLLMLDSAAAQFGQLADDTATVLATRIQAKRVKAQVEKVRASLKVSQRIQNENSEKFMARWAESSNGSSAIRFTPIPVDGLARDALWHKADESGIPRGVACVSATLPKGFGAALGVAEPIRYPSPFGDAMLRSAVYVPAVTDPSSELLLNDWGKFDTQLHAAWASKHIIELVKANDGRALVVSATNNGAARYARDLELALAGTGIKVHAQGSGRERSLASFREDERSVLVGTRSYMTGIDLKGEGLSLIVLDRPPRAAGNVVDDARVALVMRQKNCTRAEAQLDVYVADAAGLLDQARGRLIRHGGDSGMVAVLDPRINGLWPLWTSLEERAMYFEPLLEFGTRIARLDEAGAWLRTRRTAIENPPVPPTAAQAAQIAELMRQLELTPG